MMTSRREGETRESSTRRGLKGDSIFSSFQSSFSFHCDGNLPLCAYDSAKVKSPSGWLRGWLGAECQIARNGGMGTCGLAAVATHHGPRHTHTHEVLATCAEMCEGMCRGCKLVQGCSKDVTRCEGMKKVARGCEKDELGM